MSNNFFKFKQFTVFQDHCAMKVGTDGVLLGAWAEVCGSFNVLDVGTGTGLIALMIAQRFSNAIIDAIEINKECVVQAKRNVNDSPFNHQVSVQQKSFQDFVEKTNKKFDLIISNPPYFQNSLKSSDLSRSCARHDDSLSFYEIISKGSSLLSSKGRIALILPYEFKHAVLAHAATENLYAYRIVNVFPTPSKPPKRLLVELTKSEDDCIEEDLIIEHSRHQYTEAFKLLTKEFYL